MSFATRTHQGSVQGSVVSPLADMMVDDERTGNAACTATVTIKRDGSIAYVGNGSAGPAAWFAPTGGTPGDNYWVEFVLSGHAPTSGDATGSTLALSSDRSWSWHLNAGPGNMTYDGSVIKIWSDAARTTLLASSTLSSLSQVLSEA